MARALGIYGGINYLSPFLDYGLLKSRGLYLSSLGFWKVPIIIEPFSTCLGIIGPFRSDVLLKTFERMPSIRCMDNEEILNIQARFHTHYSR